MTTPHDRRLTPAVPAGIYGRPMRVTAAVVPLRPRPDPGCSIDTELVYGETVDLFHDDEGWAYVQAKRDGYVGYVADHVLASGPPATHCVSTLRTYVYAGPSIKIADPLLIPEGAEVCVVGHDKDFAVTDTGGYIYAAHLRPLLETAADFVSVAERYLGTPYLWGGRTSLGLDCSGLLQMSLRMAGVEAPRDSDMLERFFPVSLPITDAFTGLQRGDAIFWKGHCGIMRDASTLLHANGHHMLVASEPLAEATSRILAKSYGAVTSIKRL